MRPRLFWIILAIIGVALILLMVNNDSGSTFGLSNDRFGRSTYLAVWGLAIAAALFSGRRRFSHGVRNLAVWTFIVLGLVAGYQYRYEAQDVVSRVTAGLVPGSPLSVTGADGRTTVTLEKLTSGHFGARATVDGTTVPMIVDTGATTTVLTASDARRAGIDIEGLSYVIPVATANGRARAATAEVAEIDVGGIRRRHERVLVAEPGSLDESLLGMDFIGSLSGFDVRGDRMVLRD